MARRLATHLASWNGGACAAAGLAAGSRTPDDAEASRAVCWNTADLGGADARLNAAASGALDATRSGQRDVADVPGPGSIFVGATTQAATRASVAAR